MISRQNWKDEAVGTYVDFKWVIALGMDKFQTIGISKINLSYEWKIFYSANYDKGIRKF